MRARELGLGDLLDLGACGGLLSFAGSRAVVMDTLALGLLRRELIETVGFAAARVILTRFGYSHGWRMAQSLEHHLAWDTPREWKVMGGFLHGLQGHVCVRVEPWDEARGPEPFAHATWYDSYEVEQHLLHFGKGESPVCWTLTGFASGYLSYVHEGEFYALESQCAGCGAAVCRMEGRRVEDWDEGARQKIARRYGADGLERSMDELLHKMKELEDSLAQGQEVEDFGQEYFVGGMVVRSKVMWEVLRLAQRVAPTDTTVLLQGESGVGKEQMARFLHRRSLRAQGPFVAINCGAFQDNLLESELFGHAKGAFSGAHQAREGLFEAANGGTLFLDEIGEISPMMQVKLLRVLQERQIRRVGENKARDIDVRVLAATHRDLEVERAEGRFREDLLYRIKVFELCIPPLRERKEDVLELARVFLDQRGRQLRRSFEGFRKDAVECLLEYSWPGNVRELANAVEYASILAQGRRISSEDLPRHLQEGYVSTAEDASTAGLPLDTVIQAHIERSLALHQGNRKQTASQLGISEATLYRRLRDYKRSATRSE